MNRPDVVTEFPVQGRTFFIRAYRTVTREEGQIALQHYLYGGKRKRKLPPVGARFGVEALFGYDEH